MRRLTGMTAIAGLIAGCLVGLLATPAIGADGQPWTVEKYSGAVWVTHEGAQLASFSPQQQLAPGDSVRTGRNGRMLLTRGEERILIAPNSEIGLPRESKDGLATTISQRAGSILLDVEKRNVQHFSVETPLLAAIVKGTQFRVTVTARGARVDVMRGQVQVADFKSGQSVLVLPEQNASVNIGGKAGLILGGKGQFNPIEQGAPRASGVRALLVPKSGLGAPHAPSAAAKAAFARAPASALRDGIQRGPGGSVRIGAPIGEVTLDYKKATRGLAHDARGDSGAGANRKDGLGTGQESASTLGGASLAHGGTSSGLGGTSSGLGGTSSAVGGGASSTGASGGGIVSGVTSTASGVVSSATTTLGNTVNTVTNTATSATNGLTNTVSGVLSRLR